MNEILLKEKIVKLLMLTTSDNDHEALQAIRTANKMLTKSGSSWNAFLKWYEPTITPKKPEPKARVVPEDDIQAMIDYVLENAWSGFDDGFILSIQDYYEKNNRLSYSQAKALKNVYERVVDFVEDN